MTKAQIIAAGIDPNDPNNQNVVFFTINLAFNSSGVGGGRGGGGGGGLGGGAICGYWNGYHIIPSKSIPAGFHQCALPDDDDSYAFGGYRLYASGNGNGLAFLVIPGKATSLKEFFDVSFMVTNLSQPGFDLTNGSATLDVPAGMSLGADARRAKRRPEHRRYPGRREPDGAMDHPWRQGG